MSRIENYVTENDALSRIEELRAEGVADRNITVLSQQPVDKNFFNSNEINFRDSEGSAWDKFVSFFSTDDPEEKVLNDLGLSESEQVEYRNSLNAGEVLVYVERTAEGEDSTLNYGETRDTTEFDNTSTTAMGAAGGSTMNNDKDLRNDDLRGNPNANLNNDPALDGRAVDADAGMTEEERIQLREERVNVDKENVQAGEVRVNKHVETDKQEFDVPVEHEEVVVERHEVDDVPAKGSFSNTDDVDEVRIPVNEERVNVTKENVVDEEVVIKKEKHQDVEHVSEDVRREEIDIEEEDFRKNDNLRNDDNFRK